MIYSKHRWYKHHIKQLRIIGKRSGILSAYRSLAKGIVGETIARRYLDVLYSRNKIKYILEKPEYHTIENGVPHIRQPDGLVFFGKNFCPLIIEIKFGRINEEMVQRTKKKYKNGYIELSSHLYEELRLLTWRARRFVRKKTVPAGIIMISANHRHDQNFLEEMLLKHNIQIIDKKYIYQTIDSVKNKEKYVRSAIIQNIDRIANRIEHHNRKKLFKELKLKE